MPPLAGGAGPQRGECAVSAGLENIRQVMADFLREKGICAVTTWPMEPRAERDGPVVAVSLRKCKAQPASFQDYLGERYDPAADRWEERFGKRAELTFGLDIYGPEKGDGEKIQAAFDKLAGALLLGGPEGMDLREFSCGETVRDGESRRLKRHVEAVCNAWLCAAGGGFIDFELRGVMRQ